MNTYSKVKNTATLDPAFASAQSEEMQRTRGPMPAVERSGRARRHGVGHPSPLIQPKLKLGRFNDRYEQEADRMANRMVGPGQAAAPPSVPEKGVRRHNPSDAPPAVSDAIGSSGHPLDAGTRAAMEPKFGYDFNDVRIHTGREANRSARALHARAFTVGNNVVFGEGEYAPDTQSGQKLLAHELTHVVQQTETPAQRGVVQRAGFFETIKRFFGGGTFSDDELQVYLYTLESPPYQIEGHYDSDNKARAVVNKGLHKKLALSTRILLIREMLSGFTGDDDEEAILKILRDATPLEREVMVERIGIEELQSNFQGKQFDALQALLATSRRAGKQPLSSSWFVAYSTQGATELRTRPPGLHIDQLDILPNGAAAATTVATQKDLSSVTGAPQAIASGVAHPRDTGGSGYLAFRLAPVGEDGQVGPPATVVPVTRQGAYAPLTFDKHRVDLNLDVEYETQQAGSTTHTTGTGKETGKATTEGEKQTQGTAVTTGTTKGTSSTASSSKEVGQGSSTAQTQGSSTAQTTGSSTAKTTGSSTAQTTGSSTAKTTGSSTATTKGSSTTKTSGKETTFKFQAGGKLDADLSKLVKGLGGKMVGGGILGKLLSKAGSAGRRLLGVLGKLGKLGGGVSLLLSIVGDAFSLSGTLTGDIARTYISSTSDTQSQSTTGTQSQSTTGTQSQSTTGTQSQSTTGTQSQSTTGTQSQSTTGTQSQEQKTQTGTSQTQSTQESQATTKSSATEKSKATTLTDIHQEQSSDAKTQFVLVPVIKKANLTFEVKK